MIAMCGQWVLEGDFVGERSWGSETRPDYEADWWGLGAGERWKAERREQREVSRRGSEKASNMGLQHTSEMCSSGKFVYFRKCSKFSTDSFLFFGLSYSLPTPHPPPFPRSVVLTNCVALCLLSQYKKASFPPCLFFQTSTDSMCILKCKRKHVCIFFKCMGSGCFFYFFFSQV